MRVSHRRSIVLLAATATAAAGAIAPAAANAATVTVTGDTGAPVALGAAPVAIRYLNPDVTITPAAGEWVGFSVTGPTGASAAAGLSCVDPGGSKNLVNYFGNGVYTVTLQRYQKSSSSNFCSSTKVGAPVTMQFTINAGVAIDQAPAVALTRNPGAVITNDAPIHVNLNPGGISNQIFYGFNSGIAPDGSLAAPVDRLFADSTTGAASVPLNKGPGVYTIVGRAEGFNAYVGDIFTAWSAPAGIRVYAPFDLKSLSFPDSRGPSYRLRAKMGETFTNGRVSISLARGSRSGKYHSLGSVKVRGHAVSKRFRATRSGTYRLRFKYKGNEAVAGGWVVAKIRITRRIVPRSAAASLAAASSVH